MNDKQRDTANYYEDEVDLREIFELFWKKKTLIVAITLIAAILTGLFSMFVLTPVYNTKLSIVINMPQTYNTRYGDYNLPIVSNEQYLNFFTSNDVLINTIKDMGYDSNKLTVESLRKRIKIPQVDAKANANQNSFQITVSADNSEESLKLAKSLYDNYIDYLDAMTKERAINYFSDYFNVQIKTLENSLKSEQAILKKNEELLADIPQTINQKEAMQAIKDDLPNSIEYVVVENIINPNYTKIESDIITNKQTINSFENNIQLYNGYLAEIAKEEALIDEYFKSGKATRLETSILGIVETSVYLPSPPIAPTEKASPSNLKNVIIGAFLGGMMAVFIVFVKDYWWKKD